MRNLQIFFPETYSNRHFSSLSIANFEQVHGSALFIYPLLWACSLATYIRQSGSESYAKSLCEDVFLYLNFSKIPLGTYTIKEPNRIEKSAGGPNSLNAAIELIKRAENPVILAGGEVVMANAVEDVKVVAEFLSAPVCTTYLHNDSFPASHSLWCGPLGYLGHQTAMNTIKEADLVIAVGSRYEK